MYRETDIFVLNLWFLQKISHENNNLIINDPPYFMSDSYLTCTVDGADCYSKIFHSVTVQSTYRITVGNIVE